MTAAQGCAGAATYLARDPHKIARHQAHAAVCVSAARHAHPNPVRRDDISSICFHQQCNVMRAKKRPKSRTWRSTLEVNEGAVGHQHRTARGLAVTLAVAGSGVGLDHSCAVLCVAAANQLENKSQATSCCSHLWQAPALQPGPTQACNPDRGRNASLPAAGDHRDAFLFAHSVELHWTLAGAAHGVRARLADRSKPKAATCHKGWQSVSDLVAESLFCLSSITRQVINGSEEARLLLNATQSSKTCFPARLVIAIV